MRIPKIGTERLQFLRGIEHGYSLSGRDPLKLGLGLGM
jgi:hypothetical protein